LGNFEHASIVYALAGAAEDLPIEVEGGW